MEQGSHEVLMRSRGLYAEMWELQAAEEARKKQHPELLAMDGSVDESSDEEMLGLQMPVPSKATASVLA